MAYDQDFYAAYAAYLKEPRVREQHGRVFRLVKGVPALSRVLDLGCGQGNEYFHFAEPERYVGLDRNAQPADGPRRTIIQADYRDPVLVARIAGQLALSGAVSLFSIECTAPRSENYAFYAALFEKTRIAAILAAGFYYVHAREQETVGEAGGITSWQTIEPIEAALTPLFRETRIVLPCPSTLFGEDVVEVWKLLERA